MSTRLVEQRSGGTLVVVPLSLLDNWGMELCKHLSGDYFNWRRHHAQNRLQDMYHLSTSDIILTTYTTLAKEWKAHVTANASLIFSHEWHRIILDEAHEIKDLKTAKAQANDEITGGTFISAPRSNVSLNDAGIYYAKIDGKKNLSPWAVRTFVIIGLRRSWVDAHCCFESIFT
ncbi:SNF2 family N-terminal domain-containing protein [Colletotrichum phormii]|uniref:SNF2 family N-terminal domain-containing protein n=1 Tax=Colletotrichum phormii TaxID=359342 RepID=A0AAJ0EK16_9PEZI|nr:SNF2 family N-terminal domain-containing protein [Colletotrichum phormii]KAK1639490.1 SNF2 family N-terminal domain-containing protein [Colletotrichum phormii]